MQRHFNQVCLVPLTCINTVKTGLSGILCKLSEISNWLKSQSGHYFECKKMSSCLNGAMRIPSPM